jgi:hypothetical protein
MQELQNSNWIRVYMVHDICRVRVVRRPSVGQVAAGACARPAAEQSHSSARDAPHPPLPAHQQRHQRGLCGPAASGAQQQLGRAQRTAITAAARERSCITVRACCDLSFIT